MGNKISILLLTTLILGATMLACKTPKPTKSIAKIAATTDTWMLYRVHEYPTNPGEFASGQYYLHDYAASDGRQLSKAEMDELRLTLQDPGTFDSTAVKSCPMLAKMALDFKQDGKSKMTLVMSPSPCGKVLVFEGDSKKQPKCMELAPGNKLEAIVFGGK